MEEIRIRTYKKEIIWKVIGIILSEKGKVKVETQAIKDPQQPTTITTIE